MSTIASIVQHLVAALLVAAAVALLTMGMLGWAEATPVSDPNTGDPGPWATDAPGTDAPTAGPTGRQPTASAPFVRTPYPVLPSGLPTPSPTGSAGTSPAATSSPGATSSPAATSSPSANPPPTADASPSPGASIPAPSAPPTASPTTTATPRPRRAVATRVVIPAMGIDLPVISRDRKVRNQGPNLYPPCDVALYHTAFAQPGVPGTTYLYAHAREGMFLPLLEASQHRNGRAMIGDLVQVYTSDDREYVYRITKVKKHALDFSLATDLEPGEERLILQTSEGPRGTVPKLQIVAEPVEVLDSTRREARPQAHPRACYDTP